MSYDSHHRMTLRGGRIGKPRLTEAEAKAHVALGRKLRVMGRDEWGCSKIEYVDSVESLTEVRLRLTRRRFYRA